ncbi:flagellar basal body-associated FliL family protein [Thermochromatium tepidum]|jgi:Flagellar basal body-associated protein|uniref:Flagellar protein FliL n=1 Tax=Thermochromatium tepidum ATCC 43061 TaxID=316276 RepID=A0A6I6E7L6_THETI|nr:flagellar basal body-associated FliL family protein [Thermochromatium tepidum]QGU32528.1 flagellar basal body protein FliL [Thermochromatium tepidum ATCC 43061]
MIRTQPKIAYLLALCLVSTAPQAGSGKEDKEGAASPYPGYMAVDPLIVNLAKPRTYLKLSLQFFVDTQSDADLITQHMPRLRDRMISLLGGRELESISTPDAREQLRIELLDSLRKTMMEQTGRPAISAIYFTDFIAQ